MRSSKMIHGSEKRKRRLPFELYNSCVYEKRSNIGRPPKRSRICLITSMTAERIERFEVLLPVNHN